MENARRVAHYAYAFLLLAELDQTKIRTGQLDDDIKNSLRLLGLLKG